MNDIQEDVLEEYSETELDKLLDEEEDIYTTIQKYLGDYVSTVVEPLFKESAELDAKYARALSYPVHIITAVFTGAILYIYDRTSTGQVHLKTHDIKLLCTALTLHDVNKYWNEIIDSDYGGNYRKLIQDYFKTDPFNLKTYFPTWDDELEEIVFLVQHTQESDDAQHESRFSRPRYAKLLPYIKIGDKIASLSKLENPLQEIYKRLKNEMHDVHLLQLPDMPQQLLSQAVYRSAKKFLLKSGGIPLLISPQGMLYLSSDEIQIDPAVLKKFISVELADKTEAKPVLNWKKFDLDPILLIPLDKENRFDIYLESVRGKTESGLLDVLGKTAYPPEKELQESLACITYFIYNDKKSSDWTKFPELESTIQEDHVRKELQKVGQIRQNFANQSDVGVQKCKAYTIYELVQKHTDYAELLRLLHDFLKDAILSKLVNVNSSALDFIVKLVCAHNQKVTDELVGVSPKGSGDVCFMCGAFTDKLYKPGIHFLKKGGFTKRATLKDQYKRYCDACQIEYQLINSLIQNSGFRVTEDLMFFYFYFDSVFANIDPFQEQMSKVEVNVKGTKTGKLGLNFTLGDFDTPFHIEPMAIRLPKNKTEHSSKSTRRARAIHTAIRACLECGCKCVVTSPYTLTRMYNDLFYNERPTTLEKNLGIDHIRTFRDARRIVAQLDFINQFDGMKGLYRVQRFEPITVIPYVKREIGADKFVGWTNKKGDYLHQLLGDETMDMKEIAEKGFALFGTHRFGGSYKRVKIFRTSLDTLMASKAQKYPDDEAVRFAAAEVMKDVLREQYSKKKGKDIPAECLDYVGSIAEYLKQHNLWNVKKMSQWKNPLTDVYEFEYICATKKEGDTE